MGRKFLFEDSIGGGNRDDNAGGDASTSVPTVFRAAGPMESHSNAFWRFFYSARGTSKKGNGGIIRSLAALSKYCTVVGQSS